MTEVVLAAPLAFTLHWEDCAIIRLAISWSEGVAESLALSDEAKRLMVALTKYGAGEAVRWPDLPLALDRLTRFQRTVLEALATVPHGATCTYGELGARIGKPRAAQAIGRAMGANPFPLIYPCHRVIGSNGSLTGFSAEGGVQLKQHLLRHEGAIL